MRAVRADARPVSPAAARSAGLARGVGGDGIVLARLVDPLLIWRAQQGGGAAFFADSEGAHLRADRRDRRRPHDIVARAARRRTQLGLSLLLAAGRDFDADGAGFRGLSRGSAGVAGVASAERRGKPEPASDHVWL